MRHAAPLRRRPAERGRAVAEVLCALCLFLGGTLLALGSSILFIGLVWYVWQTLGIA